MDFQSAMDTFVEAWMAANTKTDQVQVNRKIIIDNSKQIATSGISFCSVIPIEEM